MSACKRISQILALNTGLWLGLSTALQAAGPVDPDWPCIQRQQPKLSMGQLWSGPLPSEQITRTAATADIQAKAQFLALRRTTMAEAESLITDFAAKASPDELQALFLATFNHIQTARDRVMAGITSYAHRQAQMQSSIDNDRHRLQTLLAAQPPDFDAIDQAEIAVDWATRIFQDRQQSLTYICETPVVLEKRAFAIARMVAKNLPN